jgi:hypothetical protein
MKKLFLLLLAVCVAFPLLNISCKKEDVTDRTRVYFTYRIGYYQTEPQQQCIAGDGLCDFEIKDNWRPSGPMPEGYGFGYLTLDSKLKLKMVIYMPFLAVSTYKQHYEDGVASLPGPWKVAAELTTKLGLIDGYTVSVGDYEVALGNEDGYDVLIITF